jgi:hypothetical protein
LSIEAVSGRLLKPQNHLVVFDGLDDQEKADQNPTRFSLRKAYGDVHPFDLRISNKEGHFFVNLHGASFWLFD